MKKVGLILAVCLLIASCGGKRNNTVETVEITDIVFDTLRVEVLILNGVVIDKVVDVSEVDN